MWTQHHWNSWIYFSSAVVMTKCPTSDTAWSAAWMAGWLFDEEPLPLMLYPDLLGVNAASVHISLHTSCPALPCLYYLVYLTGIQLELFKYTHTFYHMHWDKILSCFGDNNFNLGSVKKGKTLPAKPSVQSGHAPEEGAALGAGDTEQWGWHTWAAEAPGWQVNPQAVSSDPSAAAWPWVKPAWMCPLRVGSTPPECRWAPRPGLQRLWAVRVTKKPAPDLWGDVGMGLHTGIQLWEKGAALGHKVSRNRQERREISWRMLPQSPKSHLKTQLCLTRLKMLVHSCTNGSTPHNVQFIMLGKRQTVLFVFSSF